MKKTWIFAIMALLFTMVMMAPVPSYAVPVDLELVLAVDVSGSVSTAEFNLQRDGYVAAVKDSGIVSKIMSGGIYHAVAMTLVYWSGQSEQQQAVGWTLINDQATADAFSTAIAGAGRPYNGLTAIGDALEFSADLFAGNDFDGDRLVIDVSGDGATNDGTASSVGRDYALAHDVDTINGLVILGESGLQNHYLTQVIGGTGAFVAVASDFNDFQAAILDKLAKEINPVPEPSTILLFGVGLVGLAGLARKKMKK